MTRLASQSCRCACVQTFMIAIGVSQKTLSYSMERLPLLPSTLRFVCTTNTLYDPGLIIAKS